MNHIVDVWMLRKHFVQSRLIGDIDVVEYGSFAADQFKTIEDFLRRIVEIVCDNNFITVFQEREGGERANVANASVAS